MIVGRKLTLTRFAKGANISLKACAKARRQAFTARRGRQSHHGPRRRAAIHAGDSIVGGAAEALAGLQRY
jgi:hypothetical protein